MWYIKYMFYNDLSCFIRCSTNGSIQLYLSFIRYSSKVCLEKQREAPMQEAKHCAAVDRDSGETDVSHLKKNPDLCTSTL